MFTVELPFIADATISATLTPMPPLFTRALPLFPSSRAASAYARGHIIVPLTPHIEETIFNIYVITPALAMAYVRAPLPPFLRDTRIDYYRALRYTIISGAASNISCPPRSLICYDIIFSHYIHYYFMLLPYIFLLFFHMLIAILVIAMP